MRPSERVIIERVSRSAWMQWQWRRRGQNRSTANHRKRKRFSSESVATHRSRAVGVSAMVDCTYVSTRVYVFVCAANALFAILWILQTKAWRWFRSQDGTAIGLSSDEEVTSCFWHQTGQPDPDFCLDQAKSADSHATYRTSLSK